MPIPKAPPTAGHLGQGVAYPLQVNASGRLVLASGNNAVNCAMSAIFQTAPGERVMQPDNGAAVGLFEPVRDTSEITQQARQTVAEHEPRVDSDSIEVLIDRIDSAGNIEITVNYRIVGEANPQTLTYPYFVREAT